VSGRKFKAAGAFEAPTDTSTTHWPRAFFLLPFMAEQKVKGEGELLVYQLYIPRGLHAVAVSLIGQKFSHLNEELLKCRVRLTK
jgi:hypothetical protein